jgi:hypothetical protein
MTGSNARLQESYRSIYRRIYRIFPRYNEEKHGKMSTCNWLILETMLGFQPKPSITPENLPGHWIQISVRGVPRFGYELADIFFEDFLDEFAMTGMR